jgi:hypothetical protein
LRKITFTFRKRPMRRSLLTLEQALRICSERLSNGIALRILGGSFLYGTAAQIVSASPGFLASRARAGARLGQLAWSSPSQKPFGQDENEQPGKRQCCQFQIPAMADPIHRSDPAEGESFRLP